MKRHYKVYCIASTIDRSSYVGKTCLGIDERLSAHKFSEMNPVLRSLVRSGNYKVTCLWSGDDEAECNRVERMAALAQDKPINRFMISNATRSPAAAPSVKRWSKRKKKHPRRDGIMVCCSRCREVLPSVEYHSDCRRSVGLSSRCKRCRRMESSLLSRACVRKQGRKHIQKAYMLAKRWCGRGPYWRSRLAEHVRVSFVRRQSQDEIVEIERKRMSASMMAEYNAMVEQVRAFV